MLNKIILMGRLVANPVKHATNDKTFWSFSLAVDTGRKDGDDNPITYFFDCSGNDSKAYEHIHKGDKIAVEGSLRQRRYTAKDNSLRIAIDVVVNEIEFIDVKKDESLQETQE